MPSLGIIALVRDYLRPIHRLIPFYTTKKDTIFGMNLPFSTVVNTNSGLEIPNFQRNVEIYCKCYGLG